ncbi:MAG: hypothetical protein QOD29_3247 [Alphaproteobacteria bacterium]|jgi:hypothetical protein|nr:hypothetical protein [Alphaproteobacteria bacterium]
MPGLGPGIHVFAESQGVDGRDKPGHDDRRECKHRVSTPTKVLYFAFSRGMISRAIVSICSG